MTSILLFSDLVSLSICCERLGDVQSAMQLSEEAVAIARLNFLDKDPELTHCEFLVQVVMFALISNVFVVVHTIHRYASTGIVLSQCW